MASAARRDVGRPSALPALDAVALIAFTVVGVSNHDGGLPAAALARVGIPLLVAWFAAARVFGTYRTPGIGSLLTAWATAVPVAALVRTVVAGGPWNGELATFMLVAMAFTLLFLLLARGVATALGLGARPV